MGAVGAMGAMGAMGAIGLKDPKGLKPSWSLTTSQGC